MRKEIVIQKVARKTLVEQKDVELIVSALLDVIKEEVGRGHRIDFRNFGCFQPKVRKAKVARDITRNKVVHVPERIEPSFRHSKKYFTIDPRTDV